jgi:hypothetical protein
MASEAKKKPTRKNSPKPDSGSAHTETLSKFEKWTPFGVRRSLIKNAPYNPRVISDEAKKRLKENIKTVGLVQPIIWNKTTGNCLGGHQRLAVLDALEGRGDYFLTVAVVELDEKTEKEQNVFLNNTSAQGDWDIEALAKLFKEDKISVDATGFDMADLYQLFGDSPLNEQPEELAALGDKCREGREAYMKLINRENAADEVDFYGVVVFESDAERGEFCKLCGVPDNKFIDGRRIMEIVRKIKVKKPKPAGSDGAVPRDAGARDKPVVPDEPTG